MHATILTNPVPVLLAYRADDGPWQTLSTTPITASWSSLLAQIDMVELVVFTFKVEQDVQATAGWLEAHSATSLSFDRSLPGYSTTWDPVLTTGDYRSFFELSGDVTGDVFASSGIVDRTP